MQCSSPLLYLWCSEAATCLATRRHETGIGLHYSRTLTLWWHCLVDRSYEDVLLLRSDEVHLSATWPVPLIHCYQIYVFIHNVSWDSLLILKPNGKDLVDYFLQCWLIREIVVWFQQNLRKVSVSPAVIATQVKLHLPQSPHSAFCTIVLDSSGVVCLNHSLCSKPHRFSPEPMNRWEHMQALMHFKWYHEECVTLELKLVFFSICDLFAGVSPVWKIPPVSFFSASNYLHCQN